jgi:hypothetical protein
MSLLAPSVLSAIPVAPDGYLVTNFIVIVDGAPVGASNRYPNTIEGYQESWRRYAANRSRPGTEFLAVAWWQREIDACDLGQERVVSVWREEAGAWSHWRPCDRR